MSEDNHCGGRRGGDGGKEKETLESSSKDEQKNLYAFLFFFPDLGCSRLTETLRNAPHFTEGYFVAYQKKRRPVQNTSHRSAPFTVQRLSHSTLSVNKTKQTNVLWKVGKKKPENLRFLRSRKRTGEEDSGTFRTETMT